MNEKENLITIIKQKGSCFNPIYIDCNGCPLASHCKDYDSDYDCSLYAFPDKAYKLAIETFINKYGEEELIDLLL